jgi:hypothetical protein
MEKEPRENSEVAPKKLKWTLEDLVRERQWDSGFGSNNPGAFSRQLAEHRDRLREIETYLKSEGVLEKTEADKFLEENKKINEELNRLYPDVKSKTIVEYNGKKYQIRYFPLRKRQGKVLEWEHAWWPIEEEKNK